MSCGLWRIISTWKKNFHFGVSLHLVSVLVAQTVTIRDDTSRTCARSQKIFVNFLPHPSGSIITSSNRTRSGCQSDINQLPVLCHIPPFFAVDNPSHSCLSAPVAFSPTLIPGTPPDQTCLPFNPAPQPRLRSTFILTSSILRTSNLRILYEGRERRACLGL